MRIDLQQWVIWLKLYKILQDEVIFPASNAGIVDLPEGRLPRSYRQ